jgi:hypothetical protein
VNDSRRSLALYGWPEKFAFDRDGSLLVSLVDTAKVDPNKITFFLPGVDRGRQRTVSKTKTVTRIIDEFGSFGLVAIERIFDNDFRQYQSCLDFSVERKRLILANSVTDFGEKEVVLALKSILKVFTPRYGFADVFDGWSARFLPTGTGSNQMSTVDNRRAGDLFDSIRRTHEHLNGKMHDVYALNILSDAHMNWPVGEKSLKEWIEAGGRGDLINAKPGVTIWALDEATKPRVRGELFDRGCLIASV